MAHPSFPKRPRTSLCSFGTASKAKGASINYVRGSGGGGLNNLKDPYIWVERGVEKFLSKNPKKINDLGSSKLDSRRAKKSF